MADCLISIGSNLGDRAAVIDAAVAELAANPAIQSLQASRRHITRPIGGPPDQEQFINAAARFETALPPFELLSLLQALESRAGRIREVRWGARPLDLDLLLYGDLVMNDELLILPHPRMAFRRFVLVPAVEIAPTMSHPVLGRSLTQLLEHLDLAPNYVAITGVPGVGKTRLAQSVANKIGAVAIVEAQAANGPSNSSAGLSLEAELELLNDRLAKLQKFLGNDRYAISDFWLKQSLAYAIALSTEDYRAVEASIACSESVSPKLIVLIETTFDDCISDRCAKSLPPIQDRLRDELFSRGQPPTLRLDAANPSWNEAELIAAIQAM